MRTGLVALPFLLGLLGACRPSGGAPLVQQDASARSATPATTAAPAAKEAACPSVDDAKLARFGDDRKIIDAAVPPIVDPRATLASFYDKVLAIARGRGTDHVRIAMYGDSNLTADAATGRMRRQLQGRFGDAGHGYVAMAQPWPWYSHNDVHHDGTWKLAAMRQIATSNRKIEDGHYGFANIASECGVPGCSVWVSTDPQKGAPIGWTASRFDLYFAKRPDGGRFDVAIDGAVARSVDSRAPAFEAGFERFDVADGHHEIKVLMRGGGPVRLYGVVLERPVSKEVAPSIQVDSLGTGSLNLEQLTFVKEETRRPQLERRAHDLVIIQLGTNVWGMDGDNKKNAKAFVEALRAARPGLPVLFMSPPDSPNEDEPTKSDPRIAALAKTFATIAEQNDAAFWDHRAAMGGDHAIFTFAEKGLVEHDKIHMKKQGHELMADRFLGAVWADLVKFLQAHPAAGCDRAGGSASDAGSPSVTSASSTREK